MTKSKIETYSVDKDSIFTLCNDISYELTYALIKENLTPQKINSGLDKVLNEWLDRQPRQAPILQQAITDIAKQAKKEVLIRLELDKSSF